MSCRRQKCRKLPSCALTFVAVPCSYLSAHPELATRRVLVNGFSVGAYFFSQTVGAMQRTPGLFDSTRFLGAIWDSPVDFQGVKKGLPAALTRSNMGRVRLLLVAYAPPKAVARCSLRPLLRSRLYEPLWPRIWPVPSGR